MTHNDLPDLISVPEAAKRAGVGRNTMLRAAQNGTIKAIRPGRNWLVYAGDIERWKNDVYQPNMALRYPISDDDTDTPS